MLKRTQLLLLIAAMCLLIVYISSIKFTIIDIDDITSTYCPADKIYVTTECLKQLSNFNIENIVDSTSTKTIFYHTFWEPNSMRPHHEHVMRLSILSFLATQDLNRAKFIIWSLRPLNNEKELKNEFKKYFDTKILDFLILDFQVLCSKGLFKTRFVACSTLNHRNFVAFSDFIRFLVLYSYGGIYVDGDVMFLRDMKPFWNKNFVYRWSAANFYNTAVMGINENLNENIKKVYELIINKAKTGKELVKGFYPSRIKNAVYNLNNGSIYSYKGLNVYHSVIFDPAWLCNDYFKLLYKSNVCKFSQFYDQKVDTFIAKDVFPGSFTHHLHLGNCGECIIKNGSYFYHFQSYFESKLGLI
jgi:hypothetical protein